MTCVHRWILVASAIFLAVPLLAAEPLDPKTGKKEGELVWYDIRALGVEGQGWTEVKSPFDRLPAKAEGKVRDAVWGLSRGSGESRDALAMPISTLVTPL